MLGNMKERVKEMRVFGCRLNFWNNISASLANNNDKGLVLEYVICNLLNIYCILLASNQILLLIVRFKHKHLQVKKIQIYKKKDFLT